MLSILFLLLLLLEFFVWEVNCCKIDRDSVLVIGLIVISLLVSLLLWELILLLLFDMLLFLLYETDLGSIFINLKLSLVFSSSGLIATKSLNSEIDNA